VTGFARVAFIALGALAALALPLSLVRAQEPALPQGLGAPTVPALPQGLAAPSQPAPPEGLGRPSSGPLTADPDPDWPARLGLVFTGFAELRGGARVTSDPNERPASLAEGRLHLDARLPRDSYEATLVADLVADGLADRQTPDLESGAGFLDLRQANIVTSPLPQLDIKLGRQVLTWGTGDLVFINDLFAKDWNAFFSGRDEEYLKAPSDALKASYFFDWVNLDLVYAPRFNADRSVDGSRLSYYSAERAEIVGRNAVVATDRPNRWFLDDELHVRASRRFGPYKAAVYGYRGFWKSPGGQDPVAGLATYPGLAVYGASLLGPLAGGIASVEVGYYDSLDDRRGDNPRINNSEARWLLGFERELARNLTGGVQYYAEWVQDFGSYEKSRDLATEGRPETRHTVTARLSYLTHNQTVAWSLFGFYSPNGRDGYLRPRVSWSVNDNLSLEAGGNLIWGARNSSFLGQFQRNSNIYGALRYGF
tara:strand:- start:4803 stop:6245 length:1443 start_codon:yes stop_codon:yes gene_type:complete